MIKFVHDIVGAPKAVGPYSPVVVANGFAFLSGQIGIDPVNGTMANDIVGQTNQVLDNLRNVLAAVNSDFTKVVRSTIFLASMDDYQVVNETYAQKLGEARPARATVAVKTLPRDALIEIDMIAVVAA